MPWDRIADLEQSYAELQNEVRNIRELLMSETKARVADITMIRNSQENITQKISDIAGILRDQATEKRILSNINNWVMRAAIALVAGAIGYFAKGGGVPH